MAALNHNVNGHSSKHPMSPTAIEIPPQSFPEATKTPRTPADEGIIFFESPLATGEQAVQVYELRLDADGGPNKARSVGALSCFCFVFNSV